MAVRPPSLTGRLVGGRHEWKPRLSVGLNRPFCSVFLLVPTALLVVEGTPSDADFGPPCPFRIWHRREGRWGGVVATVVEGMWDPLVLPGVAPQTCPAQVLAQVGPSGNTGLQVIEATDPPPDGFPSCGRTVEQAADTVILAGPG